MLDMEETKESFYPEHPKVRAVKKQVTKVVYEHVVEKEENVYMIAS
jgi:hypothetical protein